MMRFTIPIVACALATFAFCATPPAFAQTEKARDANIKKVEEITGIKLDESRLAAEKAAPQEIRDRLDQARKKLIANAAKYPGGKPSFTIGYSPMMKRSLSDLAGTRMPKDFGRDFDHDKRQSEAMLAREERMLKSLARKGITPAPQSTAAAPGAGPVSTRPPLCDTSATAFNWRDAGKVTPVVDQMGCGSCWAFSLAAALESSYFIRNGYSIKASEQQLLSCSRAGSCSGGWYYDALRRLSGTGAGDGTAYPYTERNTQCDIRKTTPYHWSAWGRVSQSCRTVESYDEACGRATVAEIKDALCRHGPVMTTLVVNDAFQQYRPPPDTVEVLDTPTPKESINHAVLIVGWDETLQAWLIKNSWGTENWGYNGYGWVDYEGHKIGAGATWVEARKEISIPDQCQSFSAARARVVKKNIGQDKRIWVIQDGENQVANFGEAEDEGTDTAQNTARSSLTLMRHYGIDKRCTSARSSDNSPFYFWLAGNAPPTGPYPKEDCIDIEWQRLDVNKIVSDASGDATGARVEGGANPIVYNWILSDGKSVLESFSDDYASEGIDNEAEAWKAYAYLKKHRITKLCYMSRTFTEADTRAHSLRYYRR